jgi:hypothetical protein
MAKQVTDRQGATNIVVSAAETHAERLREKFAAMCGDLLEGNEQMPDVGLLATLVARYHQRKSDSLVVASEEYDRELSDDAGPREDRDAAANALADEIIEIRDTLLAAFGPATIKRLGLEGKTDREAKAILAKAKRLVKDLKNPKTKWPTPKRKGVTVKPAEWAGDLEPHIKQLEKALKKVALELREAQAAGEKKTKAMQENDDSFGRGASFLSSAFRFVGDDVLSRQVRPSARRPGQILSEEEATVSDGEANEQPGTASPKLVMKSPTRSRKVAARRRNARR